MKIFVAGGTGVLGRASLPALVAAGHEVRSTARSAAKADLVRSLGAQPVDTDLYDAAAVRRAVADCDAVLRLTTKIPPLQKLRSAAAWRENNRLRTEAARILVDAAIAEGVRVYVHESVAFVYAGAGSQWLAGDATTDDAGTEILRATLAGEQEAERFTRAGKGIVLRFAGFYGTDCSSTVEMAQMARSRKLVQFGSGTNYFSSIYVPDAGRAVAAAIAAPAGIYNVGDDAPVHFADMLAALADAFGAKRPLCLPGFLGPIVFGPVWRYFERSLRVSNARFNQASGWSPAVPSVTEGLPLVAKELRL